MAWSHDLGKEFQAPEFYVRMNRHPGYSCSPLAYKDLIIVTAGSPASAIRAPYGRSTSRLTGSTSCDPHHPVYWLG
jgi:hypothetical protein